jgi:rhodanese-related sulfurtransferase
VLCNTLTRLLAIVGLGFVLASGHAFVRTAWMDRPPIALSRQAAPTIADPGTGQPVPTPPADPDPSRSTEQTGPETTQADPAAPGSVLDEPVKPGSITLRQARDLFENGAFFLDARYEKDYVAGHIEGAFWMPAARVTTPEGLSDLQIIEPGGTVVIYCTGGDCDASENTAIRIEQAGFSFDIRILGKGYEDWVRAGLPTASGADGTDGLEAAP